MLNHYLRSGPVTAPENATAALTREPSTVRTIAGLTSSVAVRRPRATRSPRHRPRCSLRASARVAKRGNSTPRIFTSRGSTSASYMRVWSVSTKFLAVCRLQRPTSSQTPAFLCPTVITALTDARGSSNRDHTTSETALRPRSRRLYSPYEDQSSQSTGPPLLRGTSTFYRSHYDLCTK